MPDPVDPLRERVREFMRNWCGLHGFPGGILALDEAGANALLLADLASFQAERATFYEAYRRRCDEETKALEVRAEQAEARIRELEQERDTLGEAAERAKAQVQALNSAPSDGYMTACLIAERAELRAQLAAAEAREQAVREVLPFSDFDLAFTFGVIDGADKSGQNPLLVNESKKLFNAVSAVRAALASTGQPQEGQ